MFYITKILYLFQKHLIPYIPKIFNLLTKHEFWTFSNKFKDTPTQTRSRGINQ